MIKAIIFDVDGVLMANTGVIIKIYQAAAVLSGRKRPDRQAVIRVLGMTGPDMVRRLIGKNPRYRVIQRQVWYRYESQMRLTPGWELVLKKIRLKTAIVTSRRYQSLKRTLGKGKKYFSVIITPKNSPKHKPDPKPLLLACKKLRVSPAEALYVGDALVDVKAAARAKITFIAMLSGGLTQADLKKYRIKYSLKSLKNLPGLIKEIS